VYLCIDSNQILYSDKDHEMTFVVAHHKSKMADGRHPETIENRHISQCFDQLPQNLTRWCSLTPLTIRTVKISTFQKSKTVAAAILKKLLYLSNGLTDHHKIWHNDAV